MLVEIEYRILPELVTDWLITNSVWRFNVNVIQKDPANMQISQVIEWLQGSMHHVCTIWISTL